MRRLLPLATLGLVAACSDPPPPPPPPPTILELTVKDAATGQGVAGAQVLLATADSALEVLVADGAGLVMLTEPAAGTYAVRALAAGYVTAPRLGQAQARVAVVEHETTTASVSLEPRPGATGAGRLTGRVTRGGAPMAGVLVVAQSTQPRSGWTDGAGRYAILGVPPNLYQVSAFIAGHASTTRANLQVGADQVIDGLDLELTASSGAVLSGRLMGGTGTSSVVLVHASTGEPVPGLTKRFALGGTYQIDGVPEGSYRVQAALEDDGETLAAQWALEHDPLEIDVVGTASVGFDLQLAAGMNGIQPATGETISATPTFRWPAVGTADFYVLELRDLAGQVVWGGFDARRFPRSPVLAPATSKAYDGPALRPGNLYQWRVYAAEDVTTGQVFQLLQASEALGGEVRISQ